MHIEHVLFQFVFCCKSQVAVITVMVVVPLDVVLVVHNSFEVCIAVGADLVIWNLNILLMVKHDMVFKFFLAWKASHTPIEVASECSFVLVVCFHVPFQMGF